jgi:hypothetical protein
MSSSDNLPAETTANLPPQELWPLLDQTQRQHVFQTLVQLCRQLLQTTRAQAETLEVEHA